jgi:hypothetical protein
LLASNEPDSSDNGYINTWDEVKRKINLSDHGIDLAGLGVFSMATC